MDGVFWRRWPGPSRFASGRLRLDPARLPSLKPSRLPALCLLSGETTGALPGRCLVDPQMNNGSMHSTQGDLFMAPEKAGASPVPGASPIQAPGEVTGLAFFEAWRAARLLDSHRKPMGAAGLHQAEFVWRRWLAFCAGCGVEWRRALPDDVRAFAATLTPRRLGTSLAVSPVTLRRYWRILSDLYAHAVLIGLMEENPASSVMPAVSEKTSSLALPAHLWALLQEGLPSGFGLKARRDRLSLLLMTRCALTVGEIMALTLAGVQAHAGSPEEVAL